MSWITIVWSMASAVCVTLALIHLAIWFERRSQVAHMLFALAALGAAGNAIAELGMLKATTLEGYTTALRVSFAPIALLVVSMVWYALKYFGNGRRYLAAAVTILWSLVLIVDAFTPFSPVFSEISGLRIVQTLWGESFAVPRGVISPLHHIINLADLALVVFVIDASVTLWRRGERGRALLVGGGIAGALLAAVILARMVDAGALQMPYLITFVYIGIVAVSGYPLSSEVLRAAQLARRLRDSEADLRESKERIDLAANAAGLVVWTWDIPRNQVWLSEKDRALFGFSPWEELNAERIQNVIHPEDRQLVRQLVEHSLGAGGELEAEYRVVLCDGRVRWVTRRGRVEFDVDGKPVCERGVLIDITERKQAEEKFRLVVEASPSGIILVDQKGQIVLVNAQTEKLFGYAREELVGQSVEILVPDRFRSVHPTYRGQFLAAPKARAMGAGRELFARRKDDTEFPVEIGISPIETAEGIWVLSAIVDISARKQAELDAQRHRAELAHLSRVAVMGEISASLAHELNQPLSGIVSNAAAGQRFIDRGDVDLEELRQLLADISADGRRAGDVVRGIRGMVKKEQMAHQPVKLNDVVMNVVKIAGADTLLRSCELKTSLEPNLPVIEGDPVQLQQVLLNLVINALDAMRDTPVSKRKVVIATESNGDGTIRMSVRDYGSGIPEETRERLFDPFFTTKAEGLGMGLAIARSIVESHGGTVMGENVEGGGARFHFTLPTKTGPLT